MSTILGLLSITTFGLSVFFTYKNGGQALMKYAAAAFVAAIFCVAGLVLGIMSLLEKDIFKLFPNLGIILNGLSVAFVIFLLVLAFAF